MTDRPQPEFIEPDYQVMKQAAEFSRETTALPDAVYRLLDALEAAQRFKQAEEIMVTKKLWPVPTAGGWVVRSEAQDFETVWPDPVTALIEAEVLEAKLK